MTSLFALAAAAAVGMSAAIPAQEPSSSAAAAVAGQDGGSGDARPVARAVRAEAAPEIDGLDTDAVWQSAPRITEFQEFDPELRGEPSLPTAFQVAYDDRNLYVYVRAHDPHPDSIMRALTRRDVRGPSDQLKIIIDSF